MLQAQDVALVDNLNAHMAKTAVWALHHNRLEWAAVVFTKSGIDASPRLVRDLGEFYGTAFRVYESRYCFHCNGEERTRNLCPCYPGLESPKDKRDFESLEKAYPDTWKKVTVDRCQCTTCRDMFSVPAGVMYERVVVQEKTWSTPRFCRKCWARKSQPAWTRDLQPVLEKVETLFTPPQKIIGE